MKKENKIKRFEINIQAISIDDKIIDAKTLSIEPFILNNITKDKKEFISDEFLNILTNIYINTREEQD